MKSSYIVSAKRTPVGRFQGALSGLPATQLGGLAIRSALEQAGVSPDQVDQCIMGHVLTAGVGQAPARQAALGAGLPTSVPCLTINKVCGSGLKAVMLASDSVALGHSEVVVAGGQENMTLAPHLLEKSRSGYRMGPTQVADSMIKDGLWDPYNNFHMGMAAELCVKEKSTTREEQDEFAKKSYEKAIKAMEEGLFKNELTAVEIKERKKTWTLSEDEEPRAVQFEKMPKLHPAFEKEGTITAANASKINDGGCALVVASESAVQENGLKPLAKILGHATFAQDPKWFTTAPVGAMKKVCEKTGIAMGDIDFFEINEAFSVVTMVAQKELGIPDEKVNVHGGAVAIGHPIGASGARILTTLVHALKAHGKKLGMASICIGGGEAVAVIVEAQ